MEQKGRLKSWVPRLGTGSGGGWEFDSPEDNKDCQVSHRWRGAIAELTA